MFELSYISDTIKTISDAIASIINMDVMICDSRLQRIGDSSSTWEPEYKVLSPKSHMADALLSHSICVLSDTQSTLQCKACDHAVTCSIKAMIIIPITCEGSVIGGIEIIADTSAKRKELLNKKNFIINFIQKMSELIISKLLEKQAADNVAAIRERLVTIMDSIDDAVMAIDESGHIIYKNSHIDSIFSTVPEDCSLDISKIIPRSLFINLIKYEMPFQNSEVTLNINNEHTQFLITGKPVRIQNKSIGAILTLKKLSDFVTAFNNLSLSSSYTSFDDVLGESIQIQTLRNEGKKIANSQSTILILGESGTGKEIFARAIHEYSNRSTKPFITINCAAIPDNLLESELFGYEDGAFTGARRGGKIGKFQLADGGTIFLDEIGEMPINLQAKLLRVLQERTVEKVGGQTVIKIDVRIIAATNRNLEKMIDTGEFREDLYYRLNVIPFHIPPLRERCNDIRILMYHFLGMYNARLSKNIKGFSSEAENIMLSYTWKGNVRELQNAVEYAVNMENSPYIRKGSIPPKLTENKLEAFAPDLLIKLESMERGLIEAAINHYGSDTTGKQLSAQSLGIGIATLYRKLKHYNIK